MIATLKEPAQGRIWPGPDRIRTDRADSRSRSYRRYGQVGSLNQYAVYPDRWSSLLRGLHFCWKLGV